MNTNRIESISDPLETRDADRPLPVPSTPLGLNVRHVALPSGVCSYIDEGAGPPVLLLHGAPLTSLGFVRVIRSLRSSCRVLAPDFPGWGGTSAATHFQSDLRGYARFTREFVEALQLQRFYAFVNDSSACIGLTAFAEIPTRVAGLVVADTVPIPLTGRAWLVKLALKYVVCSRLMRLLNRQLNLLPWMVVCVAPFLRAFSRSERAVLLAQFDSAQKRDRVLDLFEHMAEDAEFMQHAARAAKSRLSRVPVLLLYGQFDPMRFVGGISRYKRMFPGASARIVPLEEHFPILASGDRVARILDGWIANLEAGYGRGALQ